MSTTSTRTDGTVRPLSSVAAVGGVLTLLLTILVAVGPALFLHGVITTYGPGEGPIIEWSTTSVVTCALYVVGAGLLGAATWWFLRRMAGRRPTLLWVAGLVVALTAGVLPVVAATVAVAEWDATQTTIAAACQSDEVAAVESLRPYGTEGPVAKGQSDGTCAGWVMVPGDDAPAVMAALWQRMQADGWTTSDTDPYERTWTRDGMTVRMWHIQSSEGSTGVGVEAA